MTPTILHAVFAACLLGGRVLLPESPTPEGISVVLAATGDHVAVTDSAGAFGASLPDSLGPSVVLEFWRDGRFLGSETFLCERPRTVALPAEVRAVKPVRVTAPPLELEWEGRAQRVVGLPPEEVRAASAALPSIAEAVQQLPGVGAVGRDGFTSAPTIRGMGRDRSLVLLEGVRISSDRGVGPSASFLDPYLLGDLRLVRGTSGVAYGSGALGGVLMLDVASPTARREYEATGSASSNGDGRAAAGRYSTPIGGAWRASGALAIRRQDDYEFPSGDGASAGTSLNSGLKSGGGSVVLERVGGARTLRVALVGTVADDVGRPTAQSGRLDSIAEEEHWLGSVRLTDESAQGRSEWTVGVHRPRTMNRGDRLNGDGKLTRTTWTENTSVDATAVGRLERRRGAGTWLGGVDLFTRWNVDAVETRVDDPEGESPVEAPLDLVEDAKRLDAGAYFGWKRALRGVGEFQATGRLDWARRSAVNRREATAVAPSVDLRALYPVSAQWALSVGAGRAFRAPRIQELYFAGDRPGGSRLANPDLDPETAWTGEVGVLWGRAPFSASATAWGILADDLIVQLPVDAAGDTLRFENVTEGRLSGAELAVAWTLPDARGNLEAAYAYLRGVDGDGDPLPDIPSNELRLTGTCRVMGAASAPRLSANAALRLGAAKTPFDTGETAAWWSDVLGSSGIGGDEVGHRGYARADLGVTAWWAKRLRLDANIVNLFDARYQDRPEADAFPEPGRTLVVRITVGA